MAREGMKEEVVAYLKAHFTMTVATTSEDGPWAASVFFVHDEHFNLYFLSDPSSRHSQQLEGNHSVSAAIDEDYHDWRKIKGIQLEGTAQRVRSPIEKTKALTLYLAKFPFVKDLIPSPAKMLSQMVVSGKPFTFEVYKIVPKHLFYLDNEKGFSNREELPLP